MRNSMDDKDSGKDSETDDQADIKGLEGTWNLHSLMTLIKEPRHKMESRNLPKSTNFWNVIRV
jgi:hypothetical protein